MKVLAILGSPRKNKNTDIILQEMIKGIHSCANEIIKYELNNKSISPCTSCYKCSINGKCVIKDDMDNLYNDFNTSDVIIIASPLYFNSVSAQTKTMIDRCQAFWSSKYLLKKSSIDRSKSRKGIFICTAGSKINESGFIGAEMVIDLFFKSINANYDKKLLVSDTDNNSVLKRKYVLEEAYNIGKKICES